VELKYNLVYHEKEYFTETLSLNTTLLSRENKTVIKIKDLKNLKVTGITLKQTVLSKEK